ncbi:hypothetical protein [Streptomyces sp. NBC_00989]|uniref:hypothetical protein n=1 Tax=Streptomyces sp. NBC_00989 TaxID=2903705 RepID=UPI00386CBE73|nr:hypothetical protein OG714_42435 [Streptomyces sp. NBC_00989]
MLTNAAAWAQLPGRGASVTMTDPELRGWERDLTSTTFAAISLAHPSSRRSEWRRPASWSPRGNSPTPRGKGIVTQGRPK